MSEFTVPITILLKAEGDDEQDAIDEVMYQISNILNNWVPSELSDRIGFNIGQPLVTRPGPRKEDPRDYIH